MKMPPKEGPRVLIVADDPLARTGLSSMLSGDGECVVANQVSSQADLIGELGTSRPDAVLWDLGWNPLSTIEKLMEVCSAGIPMVGLVPDESQVKQLLATGVRSLLQRDAAAPALVAALRSVVEGLVVLSSELSTEALSARVPGAAISPEALTGRECEVLRLLALGLSNKAIAQRLHISEHTAKFHVNSVLGKLGVGSRTEAVVVAARSGLISL